MIRPGYIEDTSYTFTSRTFYIKYCDEDVKLSDIAVFRAEIEISKDFVYQSMTMECKLMYSDMGSVINSENVLKFYDDNNPPQFEVVASSSATLNKPVLGLSQFLPLNFDEQHFCVVNLSVHTLMVDFRFRPAKLMTPIELQNSLNRKSRMGLTDNETDLPATLSSIFFPDLRETEVSDDEVDKVYDNFINLLAMGYEKYRQLLIKLSDKSLNIKTTYESGESMIPSPIMLPLRAAHSPDSTLDSTITVETGIKRISFSSTISIRDASQVANEILLEINQLAGYIYPLLYNIIELLKQYPRTVCAFLQQDYNRILRERWSESIFQEKRITDNFAVSIDPKLGKNHKSIAKRRRSNDYYKSLEPLPVQDNSLFPKTSIHPILFEELFIKPGVDERNLELWDSSWLSTLMIPRSRNKGIHVFVLVHGFQGSAFDVRLIKNNISMLRPDALFLCSNSNEQETEGDIEEMGRRLSDEVYRFIRDWCPGNSLARISFIGHSLGGLIIRSALPHLHTIKDKMHLYISFSSPHLGYMQNSSKLVNAGIWVLKKLKKSHCLKQLSMTDNPNPRQTLLYKLSQLEGMEWFSHVALVSSWQDQYAPFESARIETSSRIMSQSNGIIYGEMVRNIIHRVSCDTLYRLDVNFKIEGSSIDSLIGRAAHILMIENQALMKILIYRYTHFFV
jgi:hypothetical protein